MRNKPWGIDYIRTLSTEERISPKYSRFVKDFILYPAIRFVVYFRNYQKASNRVSKFIWRYALLRLNRKYGLEISPKAQIGKGLVLAHPHCITVSEFAKIGNNCNLAKGSTVGANAGTYETWGAPTIGNKVHIGINSTVVGRIIIGDDVLIAPNTLVNRDVPSHSIVIGNPMKIIPRENATQYYINDRNL